MNATALRIMGNVPNNAFVHVPDEWRQVGHEKCSGGFEFQPVYSNGKETLAEIDLLKRGIAVFRVQIDKFTVRDYAAPA